VFLSPLVQERLHHHADETSLAPCDLLGDVGHDARLAAVVLAAVAVRRIHHDTFRYKPADRSRFSARPTESAS